LLLEVALANMPNVKQMFTKAGYTKDKAKQLLDLNVVEVIIGQVEHCTQGLEEPLGPALYCNTVLAAIPNYIEVEAQGRVITRCIVLP
jgi:hypothetical protein